MKVVAVDWSEQVVGLDETLYILTEMSVDSFNSFLCQDYPVYSKYRVAIK